MPLENFLGKCRQTMRRQRLRFRTEETYISTFRRYIEFYGGIVPTSWR